MILLMEGTGQKSPHEKKKRVFYSITLFFPSIYEVLLFSIYILSPFLSLILTLGGPVDPDSPRPSES